MNLLIKFFDTLPWPVLIIMALLLGLAPFQPEPHLVEKLRMLLHGQLIRPLDIFDLALHGSPLLLLLGKFMLTRHLAKRSADRLPSARSKYGDG